MHSACRSSMVLLLVIGASAAPQQHSVFLGKWQIVKTAPDSGEARTIKMRRLMLDHRAREYTFGPSHDVPDRLFVVRRIHRRNDPLRQAPPAPPHWVGRLDGCVSVDR